MTKQEIYPSEEMKQSLKELDVSFLPIKDNFITLELIQDYVSSKKSSFILDPMYDEVELIRQIVEILKTSSSQSWLFCPYPILRSQLAKPTPGVSPVFHLQFGEKDRDGLKWYEQYSILFNASKANVVLFIHYQMHCEKMPSFRKIKRGRLQGNFSRAWMKRGGMVASGLDFYFDKKKNVYDIFFGSGASIFHQYYYKKTRFPQIIGVGKLEQMALELRLKILSEEEEAYGHDWKKIEISLADNFTVDVVLEVGVKRDLNLRFLEYAKAVFMRQLKFEEEKYEEFERKLLDKMGLTKRDLLKTQKYHDSFYDRYEEVL